ncbi:hypothetical protein [Actinoplanes sp. NPDC051411]|uniref:hypothetical protein n=1 Tax=Actinoplanes sp. NPDC051411 TaxID=3155522 RepID=UPI003413DE83
MTRHVPYVGNGPYCYGNSFAMLLGPRSPSTAVIEVASAGPFGMQLIGGTTAFFDAYGWNPDIGCERALAAIGWTSAKTSGGTPEEALDRLRTAVADGPVFVGPLEMGHLRHQPDMTGPIGADHFVVALEVDDERVLIHDPHGFPYAEVPLADFLAAWQADTLSYGDPYTMRTAFAQVAEVSDADAIRSVIPAARDYLALVTDEKMPEGSLGNADAAHRVADLIEAGAANGLREEFIYFAVRVGARRLDDTATCLAMAGYPAAAAVAELQARLVGSLQRPLVDRDFATAAAALRELAPTYERLREALG